MPLRIQFLGQPRIQRDGVSLDLTGYRPMALLAYLIITGKAQRRDHLVDLLFDKPDDPRAALRWTLSKLRGSIGSEYILADRIEISFNFQSGYWLDVASFEAGELELYQGEFLEGLYLRDAMRFEEWLLFERQRLRWQYQAGLEQQLDMQLRRGDLAAVALTTNQLLKLDNLREDWQRTLIEAYLGMGKRGAALNLFEHYRAVIKKELGEEPSPETVALIEAIQNEKLGMDYPSLEKRDIQLGAIRTAVKQPQEADVDRNLRWHLNFPRPRLVFLAVISLLSFALLFASWLINVNKRTIEQVGRQPLSTDNPVNLLAPHPDLQGTTVTILGPYYDTAARLFIESMRPLKERSGIEVVYLSGNRPYEVYLETRLEAAELPDIVVFPQPSFLAEYVKRGKVVDLGKFLEDSYLQEKYSESFLTMAKMDGQIAGVWYTVGLKSLVWYPKQAFEVRGYKIPQTWDELIALSDQIVADGGTPWCIGIEEGDFTGWVGTDWVEDILLRTAPPETYDAWVRHELPFNSPEIRRAFQIMGQIWLNDEYVYGGAENILAERWQSSAVHLFDNPPGCYLHKQASFIPFLFPDHFSYEKDYDFFYLPPIDPQFGRPVLVSGELYAMFNDRPEVREVMRYLTTAEATKAFIQKGGYLSPHRQVPLEWFPTTADLRFAQIVLSADTYRFDGADLMPPEVGLGSFYRGITEWVGGKDLQVMLDEIDHSWPE